MPDAGPLSPRALDPVRDTSLVIEEFRRACLARGYVEHARTSLVSRHDPSIRFTNSTISVLKPLVEPRVTERRFLIQPALRLRNLSHVRRTGQMSPFGCYFMAFGAVVPWLSAGEAGGHLRRSDDGRWALPEGLPLQRPP